MLLKFCLLIIIIILLLNYISLRCSRRLPSSGLLRNVCWLLFTGRCFGTFFRYHFEGLSSQRRMSGERRIRDWVEGNVGGYWF